MIMMMMMMMMMMVRSIMNPGVFFFQFSDIKNLANISPRNSKYN